MRIRTIKPEFFTHERLFDAEQETGLPLRVAFIGLWCAADREGRFKWEPRRLGVLILPFDNVDFSRVLHALTTRGFLVNYASNGVEYGAIPSFGKHQLINPREKASDIPEPPQVGQLQLLDACLTRASRVDDACPTGAIGKGREGKGREGERALAERPSWEEFWAACQIQGGPPEWYSRDKFLAAEQDNWKGKDNWRAYAVRILSWWKNDGCPLEPSTRTSNANNRPNPRNEHLCPKAPGQISASEAIARREAKRLAEQVAAAGGAQPEGESHG